MGLADRIVDLVSSGETLRQQHHLREAETLLPVSARLCLGRAAKLHGGRIDELIGRLREAVASRIVAVTKVCSKLRGGPLTLRPLPAPRGEGITRVRGAALHR